MVLAAQGMDRTEAELRAVIQPDPRRGALTTAVVNAAWALGFAASYEVGLNQYTVTDLRDLLAGGLYPIVAVELLYDPQWQMAAQHAVVVTEVTSQKVRVHDPWKGRARTFSLATFELMWSAQDRHTIVIF
jgi:hypothetical protein